MNFRVGVIGLGYVGLPLALAASRQYDVIGYDIDSSRIKDLGRGIDLTNEVQKSDIDASNLSFTDILDKLADCNFYIITVPTPIDKDNKPDLTMLITASGDVGSILKVGDYVVYESTVYPGVTEDICVKALEQASGLGLNREFFVGYSPERINPGDTSRPIESIIKITSGSNAVCANVIDEFYRSFISAGTFKAGSIREAEAAKVIENTQRDLNIALVNELSIILNKLGLNSRNVFAAASSKWNFLDFRPGLVGGHCIGVDPYYLTFKAQEIGYDPQVILAGRKINNGMGEYIISTLRDKLQEKKSIDLSEAKILVLGLTFKENCPDIRNSRSVDMCNKLVELGSEVLAYDSVMLEKELTAEFSFKVVSQLREDNFDAILINVGHDQFRSIGVKQLRHLVSSDGLIFDIKGIFPISDSDFSL